jgi:type IV pilus assembly protein PilB
MIIDKNIGKILIKDGLLTLEQLNQALSEHRKTKENLTSIIERLGYSTEEEIIKSISRQYEVPYEEITEDYVKPDVVTLISPELARKFKTIPINLIANQLTVAMSDPLNIMALDTLSFTSGKKIKPIVCKEDTINRLIDYFLGTEDEMKRALESYDADGSHYYITEEETEDIDQEPDAAPIIKLVNTIISRALKMRASDIHIEGGRNNVVIRFRVDGILREIDTLPKKVQPSVIARVKVLASIDIAERVKSQDGRFSLRLPNGKEIDFRVSTYSTVAGESAVIRILDQAKSQVNISHLGLSTHEITAILDMLKKSSGMVLVCGPTGSGKTTTLYAMLNEINTVEKKIITIEDPVEYRLDLVNQIAINPRRGLTFPSVLRSALRQDPDILLVGEVRDVETAEISIQGALTGHLILSTLHTNSAVEAFGRLVDMGIERYYVGDVITMVIAQRLVRRLCPSCKVPYEPSMDELISLTITEKGKDMTFYRAQGCERCDYSGYRGVTGVFEVIFVEDDIKELILQGESVGKIKEEAKRHGAISMWENSVQKIKDGIISLADVVKVVPRG